MVKGGPKGGIGGNGQCCFKWRRKVWHGLMVQGLDRSIDAIMLLYRSDSDARCIRVHHGSIEHFLCILEMVLSSHTSTITGDPRNHFELL